MTASRPIPRPGILDIAPYVGGKSTAAPGVKVVKLSSNESAFGASPKAVEACRAAASSLYRYPDGNAARLRAAIGEAEGLEPSRIVCGAGSDELIGLLVHAYAGPGDEVLMSGHGFLMYRIYAQGAGAQVVVAAEKNLTADVDALLASVTPRTKIVFLANPNNPTGSYLPAAELARLHAGLPPHVVLAIDGAYAEYMTAADYADARALVDASENTVMLRTFSKIYGLPSLRIGWMYAPTAIADAINRLRGPFNVSGVGMEAAIAALQDREFLAAAVAHNTRARAWFSQKLTELGLKVYPSGGNFVLVEFPAQGKTSAKANEFLLSRGIIVRDVANYGLPRHLRITIGKDEEIELVVAALAEFLALPA